jgi:predicted DNA-binding transcriptional regulator AlpA
MQTLQDSYNSTGNTSAGTGSKAFLDRPLTSREVGALLGRNHKTIERHAKRGDIPAHFRFSRWYFLKSELDAWLKADVDSACQPCRVQ